MTPPAERMAQRYDARLAELRADLARKERAHVHFSRIRLALAAAGAAVVIFFGLRALAWVLLPSGLFVVVAFAHARLLNVRDRILSAIAFYERGRARLAHDWIGRGRTGEAYRPDAHPYADDLDIFGRGSIFELISTARTHAGEEVLARWLLEPAPPDVVRARQGAVRELMPRLDLREAIAILGDGIRVGVNAPMIRQWAGAPIQLRGRMPRVWLGLLSAVVVGTIGLWAVTGFAPVLVAASLGVMGLVGRGLQPRVLPVIESVDGPSHDLDLLVGILRTLERERFTSAHLKHLQTKIETGGRPASQEIGALGQIVAMLESRANVIAAVPAALMMWATQWAYAIEAWRERSGPHVPEWLEAAGQFEALLALASFAAENPDYAFPDIVDGPALLHAEAVAHPILPATAVPNDVRLDSAGTSLFIVSGSNMSGKSTLLRTLGVSLVLAEMGAPVRAARFSCAPMAIGASIRVQDSLTDGRSRFFAEITRLKQIVDIANARRGAVLFLFDEILGGTNSHDRRVGAEALVSSLVTTGAIGLITTHDLALGEIAERVPRRAENVHFEDRFADGVLTFDYRLRPGLVRTSNAIALMRAIGLDV